MPYVQRPDPDDAIIGVVGASGLVGQETLKILSERAVPASRIRLFGSSRTQGKRIRYGDEHLTLEHCAGHLSGSLDYALLCSTAEVALDWAELTSDRGTVLIDNSSAFRMNEQIPLVIPEVNAHLLESDPKCIANPNCSTIMMLVAINPLHAAKQILSVAVTTYQAVSGAGRAGIDALFQHSAAGDGDQERVDPVFPVPCAFDVFEHESSIDTETGFNAEEQKIIAESGKIWQSGSIPILPTCVRVPVERSHAQAITVELSAETTPDEIRSILSSAPGVSLWSNSKPLTPRSIAGSNDVYIGRIRTDPRCPRRVLLWVCCDQIRKGAALNAVQILWRLMGLVEDDPHPRALAAARR